MRRRGLKVRPPSPLRPVDRRTMPDKETRIRRCYDGIKAEILSGRFRPGERLESHLFEATYNVSSTTVRMALSELAGQRLVEALTLDGFHMPLITEGWLYDMYISHRGLMRTCLEVAVDKPPRPDRPVRADDDVVLGTDTLFNDIANATDNFELVALVSNANERLRPVRLFKSPVIQARSLELAGLATCWASNDIPALIKQLDLYYQMRMDHLRDIVVHATRIRK